MSRGGGRCSMPPVRLWSDVEAFRRLWPGNVVLKGILHPDVDTIMGLYLSSLGQLPAIMGGQDLAARRKWDNFVYETRKKLADKALQLAEEAERNDRRRAG